MESGLTGQIVPPAVEADTKHGQEYATALLQLMVETIARVPRLIANCVAWRCALTNVQRCKSFSKALETFNSKQFAASLICILYKFFFILSDHLCKYKINSGIKFQVV